MTAPTNARGLRPSTEMVFIGLTPVSACQTAMGQVIRATAARAIVSRLAVGAPLANDRSNSVATISKSIDPLRTYSAQQYGSAPELNALSPKPVISVTGSPAAWLVSNISFE